MNHLKQLLFICILNLSALSFAQERLSTENFPKKESEYAASEPSVLATIDWLDATPLGEQEEERTTQQALLITWLTNSPSVTLELHGYVTDLSDKNAELLIIFMGGYTRAVLADKKADALTCNLAGVKSVVKFYKNGSAKKNKVIEKLVAMDDQALEAWVKEQMAKDK